MALSRLTATNLRLRSFTFREKRFVNPIRGGATQVIVVNQFNTARTVFLISLDETSRPHVRLDWKRLRTMQVIEQFNFAKVRTLSSGPLRD